MFVPSVLVNDHFELKWRKRRCYFRTIPKNSWHVRALPQREVCDVIARHICVPRREGVRIASRNAHAAAAD
eukprot:COSAG02_NODE_1493_length_12330_cov_3.681710_5_plen_71_part_00